MAQRSSRSTGRRSGSGPPRPTPPAGSALDAGLRLLGRRAHSRSELHRKLGRRGYDEPAIDEALGRLAELGYLDDLAFARGHVRRRSTARGPLALAAELAARGVDRHLADQAVAGLDADAQLGAARRIAERLCGRKRWPGYREMLNSVGPKLMRRGFSAGVARAACLAAWSGTASEPDN